MIMREFQARVKSWVIACFGDEIAKDRRERVHRFLEEALELSQATGVCTKEDAHLLVEYVYGRTPGKLEQEVGGTMVTLAALCATNKVNMEYASEAELERIIEPKMMDRIRLKNLNKQKDSALPGAIREGEVNEGATKPKSGLSKTAAPSNENKLP